MYNRCVVLGCPSRGKIPGVTFHRFPMNEKRRRRWVCAMKRPNWKPTKYSVICSKHFREEDMDRSSLVYVRIREKSVPSIFPEYVEIKKTKILKRKYRQKSKLQGVDKISSEEQISNDLPTEGSKTESNESKSFSTDDDMESPLKFADEMFQIDAAENECDIKPMIDLHPSLINEDTKIRPNSKYSIPPSTSQDDSLKSNQIKIGPTNHLYSFGLYISNKLSKFDEMTQQRLKHSILNLISEEESKILDDPLVNSDSNEEIDIDYCPIKQEPSDMEDSNDG